MAQQQSSELLRVLAQLNDVAWAETLMPLLKAGGSAGAVALACKQLRKLCHGSQQELKLTGAKLSKLDHLDLDLFIRHFPACNSVAFAATSEDDVALHFTAMMPMLARLPHLHSLHVQMKNKQPMRLTVILPVLQLLRLQLPQLRSLQLDLASSWPSGSRHAWAMLGAVTQLTKLVVNFSNKNENNPGVQLQHLSALQPLGGRLQHLKMTAAGIHDQDQQDLGFLSSFSGGLKSLFLPLISERTALAAIGSCTALQELVFNTEGRQPQLDAAECAALAQLTRLTLLYIPSASDTPALLSTLQSLCGLKKLKLRDMSYSHLPVLATLTKLTGLGGSWVDAPAQLAVSLHTCPSVTRVWVSGPWPLTVFPGAKAVMVYESWQPLRLVALSQQLQQLEVLDISKLVSASNFTSLDPSAHESDRVAAIRSLTQLSYLTYLQFALNDDAEAAAIATACAQMQKLHLCVPHGSSVTALGLLSGFCRLSKLHKLTMHLYGFQLSHSEAKLLLSGLSAVPTVFVLTETAEQRVVWEAAAAAVREAGLSMPAEYILGRAA